MLSAVVAEAMEGVVEDGNPSVNQPTELTTGLCCQLPQSEPSCKVSGVEGLALLLEPFADGGLQRAELFEAVHGFLVLH